MATVQETIDNLISYIDAAVAKHSVSNRHVATVLAFLNEGLKALSSKYLSKTEDDTAGGFITFMKGLLSHGDVTVKGNSSVVGTQYVGGEQTFGSGFQTEGFKSVAGRTYGGQLTKSGVFTVARVVAMSHEIFELIYNKIRSQGGRATFSDTATIESCVYAMDEDENDTCTPEEFYENNRGVSGDAWVAVVESIDHVIMTIKKEEYNSNSVPFVNADLIYGYVNAIGESGQYARGGMCSMNIITPDEEINADGSMVVRARLSPITVPDDPDTFGPQFVSSNMPPTEGMVVAQNGNSLGKKGRTVSFFIDSEAGHIVMLQNVTTPTISDGNYAVISGLLPADLLAKVRAAYSFVDEYTPVSYAKYGIFENILQFDHQGAPIKTERYRGAWSAIVAVDNPYRSSEAKEVTYFDSATHKGSKWKCLKDFTLEEPGTGNDWLLVVAKGDKGDKGAVSTSNLLMNSNFDLFLPDAWNAISSPATQAYAIFSEVYGEKWVTFTRQKNASHAAVVKLVNGVYKPRYESFSYDDDGVYWCFVGTPDDFVIYNRLTGPSKVLTASGIASGAGLSMVDADSAIHWYMSMVPNSDRTMYVATLEDRTIGINAFNEVATGGDLKLYRVFGAANSQWLFKSHPKVLALWSGQQGVVLPGALDGFNAFAFTGTSVGAEIVVPFKIQSGGVYTLSFWTKNANPNNSDSSYVSGIALGLPKDSGFTVSNLIGLEEGSWFTDRIDLKSGSTPNWERHSVTFGYTSADGEAYGSDVFVRLYLWATGGTALFSQLKLETGDTATSYQKHERDFMLPVKSTVFKRGSSKPSVPTGGSYDSPVPEGWSDGIPEGNGAVYSSTCTFYAGGYDTGWRDVQMLADSADFDVAYCLKEQYTLQPPSEHPDGENEDWQNSPSEDAVWMATSKRNVGGAWSPWTITRVKGEVGKDGRSPNENLLLNTNFDVLEDDGKTLKSWTTQQGSIIKEGFEGFNVYTPIYQLGSTMPTLEAGKLYTFSLYQKSSATSGINTLIPSVNFANLIVSSNAHCAYNRDDNKIYFYFTEGVWQRASFTFRPTVDTTVIGFVLDNNSNKLWYLSRIKLEEGDTATAYQKHPDDLIGEDGEDGADGKDAPMTQNNLIVNSKFEGFSNKAMSGWVINNTNQIGVTENGYNNQNYVTSKGAGLQTEAISSLDNMRKYVFSVYVKPSSANDFKVSFFANSNISVVTSDGSIVYDDSSSATVTFGVAAGVWTRVSVTISAADYGNFYIKFWSESDTFRISMPKLEEGEVVTPYIPAVADLTGPAGAAGEAVFPLGDWMNDVRYVRGDNYTISVHYLIDDKYYRLKKSFPEGKVGIAPNDTEYWEFITDQKSIHAEFIMANFAMFGSKRGGVFYDRYLFSQYGINNLGERGYFSNYREGDNAMLVNIGTKDDPQYALNGKFVPNAFIDFHDGAIKCGKFSEPFTLLTKSENGNYYKIDPTGNHTLRIVANISREKPSTGTTFRNNLIMMPTAQEYPFYYQMSDGEHYTVFKDVGGAEYGASFNDESFYNTFDILCADNTLISGVNSEGNPYGLGNSEYGETGGWFLYQGLRSKIILLTPGMMVKMRLQMIGDICYWIIENGDDLAPLNIKLLSVNDSFELPNIIQKTTTYNVTTFNTEDANPLENLSTEMYAPMFLGSKAAQWYNGNVDKTKYFWIAYSYPIAMDKNSGQGPFKAMCTSDWNPELSE